MTKKQKELSSHKKADALAKVILKRLEDAMCVKLKELKPELLELRGYFQEKGRGRNILGCETWGLVLCREVAPHEAGGQHDDRPRR
jgi:hypothetical protein